GWIFDDPDHLEGYQEWQGDDLYAAYFATVAEAARSGLFQIMGHPDVIRVFGFPCQSPLLELAMPALEAIAAADVAIEINTNGKYKPVGEYYPNIALLKAAYRLGIPITLGSDAHEPANVARDFQDAVNLLREVGYKSIVTFHQKQRLEYQIAL
ncbi:MAG TPA: histidinol phosphate phosphatase, partial [Desulfobacteria bacterium]|nr:histidinol phosphate phosphatase [Desulfobacteria bacterium]